MWKIPLLAAVTLMTCGEIVWAQNGQTKSDITELIIGGEETSIRAFPWQVSIGLAINTYRRPYRHMCGGSIISPNKILSAAHCFAITDASPHMIKYLRVRAGSSRHADGGTLRTVARVITHPEFHVPTPLNNDIAVLILKSNLIYGPRIRAIQLPIAGDIVEADIELRVIGWGRLKNVRNAPLAKRLNFAVVNSIDHKICEEALKDYEKYKVTNKMFCAGLLNVGGRDACQGDSGGPIVLPDAEPVLLGIVSWGIECADPRYPGIYTLVSSFIDWINETN